MTDYLSDEMTTIIPELTVRRPVYQQDELNHLCKYAKPKGSILKKLSSKCKGVKPLSILKNSVPLIGWLSNYDWKSCILGDLVAGITVAVMHIPQGMAYAILGNVPPIVGIYMAFFPVLVYLFLGTSRHNSMGTFALICMMTGKVVSTYSSPMYSNKNATAENVLLSSTANQYSPIEVATAVTFTVAIIQLAMYVLRLGVITSLLADSLVSGFTTAAAMHVFTSQVKDLLGLKNLAKRKGPFKLIFELTSCVDRPQFSLFTLRVSSCIAFNREIQEIVLNLYDLPGEKLLILRDHCTESDCETENFLITLTYVDVLRNIDNANGVAVILSGVTIIILVFNNEVLKPRVAKMSPFPVPIEMLAVIIGTLLSVYMDLGEVYGIVTVGDIPVGLPVPSMPRLSLIPNILIDCFVITMVSYTISMSMALIFAQKFGYEVDSNQELMAQGIGNMVGSFFSCMPFTASLSRSLIQQTVGGHTQLASLISCGILLSVLLWIGPFFEPLPRCVLASIIVVALKGMLMKVAEFKKFWKLDKTDGTIWAVTFISVVLLDVEYGLLLGIVLCIGKLIALSVRPYTCTLALVPGTELYLDSKRYKGTVELPGIKIFHYSGSLNFACRQHFREEVYKVFGIVPRTQLNTGCFLHREMEEMKKLRTLILDFSALTHIDLAGSTTLGNLIEEYCEIDISVYVAGCSGPVYEMMRKCNLSEYKGGLFAMFPTVADAVHFARCNVELPAWNSSVYEDTCIARL